MTRKTKNTWGILLAAGKAKRFGSYKQFEELNGKMVLDHSLEMMQRFTDGVVLVLPSEKMPGEMSGEMPENMRELQEEYAHKCVMAEGGETRSASVRRGLAMVPEESEIIIVHDSARPLTSSQIYEKAIKAVSDGAAASVPTIEVADTICTKDGDVLDRSNLLRVQTPQVFNAEVLREVHGNNPEASDDAGLVRAAGKTVALVEGELKNLKITSPEDLSVASNLMS